MVLPNLLVALILVTPPAGRAPIPVKVTAPSKLTVGDRFDVALVVNSPPRSLVTGPLADSTGAFLLVDEKRSIKSRPDHDQTTIHLSVAGFAPGTHRLPPFVVLVTNGPRTDTLRP